ncbi:MAG: hypothetical protein KBC91_04610, partial [Candidatus Omnitrophica bacterium]|nr:hypothetical protein [Candidatus Omnitrophota bacterium]
AVTLNSSQGVKRLVLYPRLSHLGERIAMEPEMEHDGAFIQDLFRTVGVSASVLTMTLDPDEREQLLILESARKAEEVVYFCFDPHLYPGSRKLLNFLEETTRDLQVVFLRDPFGADLLALETSYLCAYGFRSVQILAAVELLCGLGAKTPA